MFESNTNVTPSSSLSKFRSFRPRIAAAVAGVVALTLVASAVAQPRTDPTPPTGRKTHKAKAHARTGRASHKMNHGTAAHRGKKADSLHSSNKGKAKGKVAAAGKSHRLHRGKHTSKSAVASAHRAKRNTRTHSAQNRMTPPASASPSH